jgi:hypothetical protein
MHPKIFAAVVRAQSESSDHGNGVQEENHVADERIWHVLVQDDLEIRPDDLTQQPRSEPNAEEEPESLAAPRRSAAVGEQSHTREGCDKTKRNIAEGG